MMSTRLVPAGTFVVPDALNVYRSPDLTSNVLTLSVSLKIAGILTIGTADAVGVVNGGSIAGAIEEIQMIDNGEVVARFTGTELLALSSALYPAPGARVASLAQGAKSLSETLTIPMAWPWPSSVNSTETGYRQRSPDTKLQIGVRFRTFDGNGSIVVPGVSGTAVLSAVTVNVVQAADFSGILPVAIPSVLSSQATPIPGAVSKLRIPLDTPDTIRAILLYGSTANRGDVADIISSLALRTDQTEIFGPNSIPFPSLVTIMDTYQVRGTAGSVGGFSATPGQSGGVYALIDIQAIGGGRLSELLAKGAGTNLRLEIDAAPSAVAGATSSTVRALLYTLKRPAGLVSAESAALIGG